MNVPFVRLELEHMKFQIMSALNKHVIDIDAQVQKAIDQFATETNLSAIIDAEVSKAIRNAVSDEVVRFFNHTGRGRAVIRDAVIEYLDDVYPPEALK